MSTFKVLTWDLSTDKDYSEALKRAEETPPEDTTGFSALRDQTAKLAYEILIEENELAILCLQNIGSDLDKIKSFLGDDFDILSDGQDTAIAYSCRFTPIKSFLSNVREGRRYTILTLKDELTEKTYNVASAHISRFNLRNPMESMPSGASGDEELQELLSKLNEFEADGTIIGLNTNTTKEHYRARLDLLEKAGFKTNDADRDATTYNEFLSETPDECKIKVDYIFTKKFSFIDFEKTNMTLEKPLINPSVHIPVIEQLEFDPSLLESAKEEDFSATTEGLDGPKGGNDPSDLEKRLRSLGGSLGRKGGTLLKPLSLSSSSSSSKPFSLYSDPVEASESPSSPSPSLSSASEESDGSDKDSSQNYLDSSASVIEQPASSPPMPTSSPIEESEGSMASPPAASSRAAPAGEEEALPEFDTAGVADLKAALEAKVVRASLASVPDVLKDLERREATAKAEAKAKIEKEKAEAEAAAAAKEAEAKKAARIAAAQKGLAMYSPAPTRALPKPPAKARKSKTADALDAVLKARVAAGNRKPKSSVSNKEKPKSPLVSCMKKTAVVGLVALASITIPLVGSFYSFE
ncbi:MAG: hypothetical protein K940chlam5_00827 [Candidatus Anoxychlamydiales bacterium]|nr:hypothetical protein [Candidatus Anoxychlamydiales bacterium]